MKNIILIVLIIAVLGVGAFLFLNKSTDDVSFDTVLPPQPIAYFEATRLEETLSQILSTQLYTNLAQLGPQQNPLKDFQNAFSADPSFKALRALMKHKVAFALYNVNVNPEEIMKAKEFPMQQMLKALESLYVTIALDAQTKAAEQIASTFKMFGQDVEVQTKKYNGQDYHLIASKVDQVNMVYTRLGNILVVTLSENTVKNAIDMHAGVKGSLASDKKFQEARKGNQGDAFSYFSMRFVDEFLKKLVSQLPDPTVQKQAMDQLAAYQGMDHAVTTINYGEVYELYSSVGYDLNQMNDKWRGDVQKCVGTNNPTIKYVPQQILGYHWNGCITWSKLLEEAKQGMAQAQEQNPMLQTFMGPIEQYVNLLGDDIGGYLVGVEEGIFPIPQLVLFIELSDANTIKSMIAPLMQNPMVRIETLDHEGFEIMKLNLPINVVTPGVAFIDNHLVIATQVELLQNSINVAKGKAPSLKDNAFYKQIKLGGADEGALAQYFNVAGIMDELLSMEQFGRNMIRQEASKKQAFKEGSVRRLEDLQKRFTRKQDELVRKQERAIALEDEIFLSETKGLDVSDLQSQKATLDNEIIALKGELPSIEEQVKDTEAVIESYGGEDTSGQMEKTVDELALPLLNALKNIGEYAGKSVVGQKEQESRFLLKVQ